MYCRKDIDTLLHIYCQCLLLHYYWSMVQDLLQRLLDLTLPFCSKVFVLGLLPAKLSKIAEKLKGHILTTARYLVTLHWKKQTLQSPTELYTRIKDVEIMESLTAHLTDTVEQHNAVWGSWHSREESSS